MADQHTHPAHAREGHTPETPEHEASHGHTHAGHVHGDVDWAAMGPVLERGATVAAPLYRRIAGWLGELVPAPRLIADVGSGPGVVSCLLAEHFPGAEVIAVDAEPELLARARERAQRLGLGERVGTLAARLPGGVQSLGPVDLAWAGRSLHHVGDQLAGLRALAERLAPGGVLALLEGGLPPRHLPRDIGAGRPGLESRLDVVEQEGFAQMRAELPDSVSVREDWRGLLREAGLARATSRTFLLDLPAPLDDTARAYVLDEFERRGTRLAALLDPEDAALLGRLLDPDSPEYLGTRDDAFVLAAHTVHLAVKE